MVRAARGQRASPDRIHLVLASFPEAARQECRSRPRLLFPENAPRVLFAHFVGDAFVREAD